MTPQQTATEQAAALRALEKRALAARDPFLAFALNGRAEFVDGCVKPPRTPRVSEARAQLREEGLALFASVAKTAREEERRARERAETAEAALAILTGEEVAL